MAAPPGPRHWGWPRRVPVRRVAMAAAAGGFLVLLFAAARALRGPAAADSDALRATVVVGVEIDRDTPIDVDLQKEMRKRFGALEAAFKALHPGVRLQVLVLPEERLLPEVRRRSRSGLGPDLLLVNGDAANQLYRQGLTESMAFPSPETDQLDPGVIARVRFSPGEVFALPQSLQPQLACFDRARITRSPATLAELLQASNQGQRFGLPMDLLNLSWTLGALGALDTTAEVLAGKPVTPLTRSRIAGWLLWLRSADLQKGITMAPTQRDLIRGFQAGEIDWITCRSSDIDRLRNALGNRLGLAPLPDGPAGPASPISRLRVLALGRDSSAAQRRAARALVAFAVNPQMQRAITVRTRELLPVNRNVSVPVESSQDLAALVAAQRQSEESPALQVLTQPHASFENRANRILIRFHYGELDTTTAADALIEALRQGAAP